MEVVDLGKQVANRVVRDEEFYKFAKDHMKLIIEEMDKMQKSVITEFTDMEHIEYDSRSQRHSITRSFSNNIRPASEITILPPLHVRTKWSGKSDRPKGSGVLRIQSD